MLQFASASFKLVHIIKSKITQRSSKLQGRAHKNIKLKITTLEIDMK